MAQQYQIGQVNVEQGNATVTGVGTQWLSEGISDGDAFVVRQRIGLYFVGNVVSNTELTLTAPYGEVDGSGLDYGITRDFIEDVPLMGPSSVGAAPTFNESVKKLLERIAAKASTDDLGTAATRDVTTTPTDTTVGRLLKVGDGALLGNITLEPESAWHNTRFKGWQSGSVDGANLSVGVGLDMGYAINRRFQIEIDTSSRMFFRYTEDATGPEGWQELYHTGNLPNLGALPSERGMWTPTLPNGGSIIVSNSTNEWNRTGDNIYLHLYFTVSGIPNDSEQFRIGGVPAQTARPRVPGSLFSIGTSSDIQAIVSGIFIDGVFLYFVRRSDGGIIRNSDMQALQGVAMSSQLTYRVAQY